MRLVVCAIVLGSLQPTIALSGPNAGGTLILHDANLNWSNDSVPPPVSAPPTSCASVDNNVAPDLAANSIGRVWKLYAAFPVGSSPRLKALGVSETFSANTYMIAGGLPDALVDFEVGQDGWPVTDLGAAGISFGFTKNDLINEVYWFVGYGYYAGETFAVAPHPIPANRFFIDNSTPPLEDAIMGYSSIGFGSPGWTAWPGDVPAACCIEGVGCTVLTECECSGVWLGPGYTCDPDPCPGACCDEYGACTAVAAIDCGVPSVWLGSSAVCSPNPCPQLGACCFGIACFETFLSDCHGSYQGDFTTCNPNPCPAAAVDAGVSNLAPSISAAPNPTTCGVTVRFNGTVGDPADVVTYDPGGRVVRELWHGTVGSNPTEAYWDGLEDSGQPAPAGVYFAKITTPAGEQTAKLVLTR